MTHDEIRSRRLAMINDHVATDHNYICDPYDQGRYCAAKGSPLSANDHIPGHVNHSDFIRGWRDETNYLATTYGISAA